MKIAFLLPRDDIHHVAHVVPVAASLADLQPGWSISILSRCCRVGGEVERQLAAGDVRLDHARIDRIDQAAFAGVDALVTSDPDLAMLRRRHRLNDLPILYLRPGASDHVEGLAQRIEGFDHVLVQGNKLRDRLVAAGMAAEDISVVGCAKLDTPAPIGNWSLPIGRGRKVVLYNPHVAPDRSSWYRWGKAVLDWFVEHDEYQLIFAPHVRLFDHKHVLRRGRLLPESVGKIEPRWLRAPNIHIDLGSQLSTARAYTEIADVYIGDAGAQLYEFLQRPRPCGFLDVHRMADQRDTTCFGWGAGIIIEEMHLFGDLLRTAQEWHEEVHADVQADMFRYSISVTEEPARRRAAMAIERVLGAAPQAFDSRRIAERVATI